MKTMISIEWMKLFGQRKSKVLMAILWISAIAVSVGNLYLTSRAGFTVIDGDQMPMTMITILGGVLLPLIAYITAVDATSTEYSKGTIRYGLMAPMSRSKYFLSKLLALAAYYGLILGGVMVLTTLINIGAMNQNIGLNIITYLGAYTITLIPMVLIALWGMFIGTYFSQGLSIGLGFAGVLALNVAQIFVPILTSVSPLGYMNMSSSLIYGNGSLIATLSMLLYVAAYYIILVALNIFRFQQKEI